ncbi:MAG: TraR/DksA family transcriptional regulator [Rubrivivax sp.]
MSLHLTASQRSWLKTELEQRHSRLEGRLHRHHEGTSRVEHAHTLLEGDDEATRAHAMDREVDLGLSDLDTAELGAVSRASLSLQDGHYGLCTTCGADIPIDRLKVEPQAARCVACEHAAEQGRRFHG